MGTEGQLVIIVHAADDPNAASDAARIGMPQPVITTVAVFTRLRLFQELLSSFVGSRQGFAVIAVSSSEIEATGSSSASGPT